MTTSNRLATAMSHQITLNPTTLRTLAGLLGLFAIVTAPSAFVAAAHGQLYPAIALLGLTFISAPLAALAFLEAHNQPAPTQRPSVFHRPAPLLLLFVVLFTAQMLVLDPAGLHSLVCALF